MNRMSIKTKILIFLVILLCILSSFLVFFMGFTINSITVNSLSNELETTVKNNISELSFVNNKINVSENFKYHYSGITTLIYSENKTLLIGQVPVGYSGDYEFENGSLKTISINDDKYLIVDYFVSFNFENNFWVRGIVELPSQYKTSENVFKLSIVAVCLMLIVVTVGGYLILKKSFLPLYKIIDAANSINEANDLDARIKMNNTNKEFNDLRNTYNSMFDRLQKSFEREKRFTTDVSHELRTPVSIIKSACEYSRKFEMDISEKNETLKMIERQSEKLTELISKLLNIARLNQDTLTVNTENINISILLEEICNNYGITFEIEEDLIVSIDKSLFYILINNLIENAIKYGDGKEVKVVALKESNEVIVKVIDNGIGISKENIDRIWNRFYKVDESRNDDSFGLGLSIVERISKIHELKINVESKIGKGSTFSVHFNKISC
ncbi:MAG: HAMP domain-containing histidine kinase [Erysipelotrichaceae bacterium]|nr:HAMP domain-containing histidine kinase [Erysipelotrichaceae bacterium]